MILLLDNFDSFTYNLVDYLLQLNVNCTVLRNDVPLEEIMRYEFDGIVLSPGPETPEKAGNMMEVLSHYHQKVPVLGICLGHQAIGRFFGAQINRAYRPMHGKLSRVTLGDDPLFQDMPAQIDAVRYNSLVVTNPTPDLEVIGWCERKEIMALRHRILPIWGVQFHPEAALTGHGLDIFKNWLTYNQIAV